jgi:cytochrome c oxidase assembly factor CtaG
MGSLAYLGALLQLVGAIWLVVLAVQTGNNTGEKVLWAIVNFVCQPIGGIIFYFVKKVGLVPLILVIIGAILMGVGYSSLMADMQRTLPH